jgi:hypothetical protein
VRVALWLLGIADVVAANVAIVAPALTVTEAGAVSVALVLESVTATPPAGAAFVSAIVHKVEAFWPMLAGLQDSDDTPTEPSRLRVAVAVILLRVAVIVAAWLFMITLAAEAVNWPTAAPFAINRAGGTVKLALLLAIEITLQPTDALFSVTVHVLAEPPVKLVGAQLTELSVAVATRLMTTLLRLLPRVAVTVADWLLETVVVVTLKAADATPAAIVTEAGTVSVELVLVRVTVAPPTGAAWVRVTVQVLEELGPRLAGLQATPETRAGATRLMAAVCELAPKVAVTVALWLLAMMAAAVALKFALVAPAATVTDAGTLSRLLVLASVTAEPPAGAVWVRVIVQALTALWPRLVGLQASEETNTVASRLMVAVAEVLL